jgi:hypothetical protein
MKQGQSYSMLFPHSMGVWDYDKFDNVYSRKFWDYWTGKFLIFESTEGGADGHTIYGSDYISSNGDLLAPYEEYETGSSAILLGNPTFATMSTSDPRIWTYTLLPNEEGFASEETEDLIKIEPTSSFLLTNFIPNVARILRTGEIIYKSGDDNNDDDVETGGHVPTINGGSDIFVTSVAEGINIAVSEPQAVGVFSATGQLIYSGWVETSVDVNLVVDGVYVVVGENNTVKILY